MRSPAATNTGNRRLVRSPGLPGLSEDRSVRTQTPPWLRLIEQSAPIKLDHYYAL